MNWEFISPLIKYKVLPILFYCILMNLLRSKFLDFNSLKRATEIYVNKVWQLRPVILVFLDWVALEFVHFLGPRTMCKIIPFFKWGPIFGLRPDLYKFGSSCVRSLLLVVCLSIEVSTMFASSKPNSSIPLYCLFSA